MKPTKTSVSNVRKAEGVAPTSTLQKPKVVVPVKPAVKIAISAGSAPCKNILHTAGLAKSTRPTTKIESSASHCKRKVEASPARNPDSSKENLVNINNEDNQVQIKDEPHTKRSKLSVIMPPKQLPPKRSTPQKFGLVKPVTKNSSTNKPKELANPPGIEKTLSSVGLLETAATTTPRRLPTFSEFVREWTEQRGAESQSSNVHFNNHETKPI